MFQNAQSVNQDLRSGVGVQAWTSDGMFKRTAFLPQWWAVQSDTDMSRLSCGVCRERRLRTAGDPRRRPSMVRHPAMIDVVLNEDRRRVAPRRKDMRYMFYRAYAFGGGVEGGAPRAECALRPCLGLQRQDIGAVPTSGVTSMFRNVLRSIRPPRRPGRRRHVRSVAKPAADMVDMF